MAGDNLAVRKNFLQLLEPLQGAIERYALRNAWNRQQAEDMVQEAVMIAWREFERFAQGTDFRAWLFRILTNTIYSFNKKTGRESKLNSGLAVEDVDMVLQREDAWASILEDPQRVIDALDARLVHAVETLSVEETQCLMLRSLEGFTYKEIAALLDMPMGTVMSHVHRARLKLRERLADMALEQRLSRESLG